MSNQESQSSFAEIRLRGKQVKLPCAYLDTKLIVVMGKWLKKAIIHDEIWVEGQSVEDPEAAVASLRKQDLKADIFIFSQKLPQVNPKFSYHCELDNFAVIALTDYKTWWESLPQESRKNVRRSAKRGVTVRKAELDDQFIQGVVDIYNETPIRQGKPFPRYGQGFDRVKDDLLKIKERSEFIGAYFEDELIGFVKLVHMNEISSVLSINSKTNYYDKRPTNALMAKAVEISCERGSSHIIYGRYTYGNKVDSSLSEFKRRNRFKKTFLPKYYVPLTRRGKIAIKLGLHRPLIDVLSPRLIEFLVEIRSKFYKFLKRSR